jgi:hypothetical protein
MILEESPEAAQWRTVEGWVSRDGHFYGADERTARYAGSTHRHCPTCGTVIPQRSYCRVCHERQEIAAYTAMPRQIWDGTGMVYAQAKDRYYSELAYAEDDLADGETMASMRLVICEPIYARPVDTDYWVDDLVPDDEGELPPALTDALAVLNKVIATLPPLSYQPGIVAVDLKDWRPRP